LELRLQRAAMFLPNAGRRAAAPVLSWSLVAADDQAAANIDMGLGKARRHSLRASLIRFRECVSHLRALDKTIKDVRCRQPVAFVKDRRLYGIFGGPDDLRLTKSPSGLHDRTPLQPRMF